jgi:hypothetical protein
MSFSYARFSIIPLSSPNATPQRRSYPYPSTPRLTPPLLASADSARSSLAEQSGAFRRPLNPLLPNQGFLQAPQNNNLSTIDVWLFRGKLFFCAREAGHLPSGAPWHEDRWLSCLQSSPLRTPVLFTDFSWSATPFLSWALHPMPLYLQQNQNLVQKQRGVARPNELPSPQPPGRSAHDHSPFSCAKKAAVPARSPSGPSSKSSPVLRAVPACTAPGRPHLPAGK